MEQELLDLVDENNNLTGKAEVRSMVHSTGLWHRTVHIYVFRKKGGKIEFLVHLRSPKKDLAPNRWDTRFGGHIESGMTVEEAVEIELEEEIGLSSSGHNLIEGEWRKKDKFPNREFSKIFFLEYPGELSVLKFNDGEVQEVKWMEIEEIKKAMVNNHEKWTSSPIRINEVVDCLKKKIDPAIK